MPHYLVDGYLPDNFDPSTVDEAMGRDIHALNKEMIAAGVRTYACGLGPAQSLRAQPDGKVLVTDGPYLETKEHVGGFWILECADMDEAVAWARKGVVATRGQGEVRAFQGSSAQGGAAGSKTLTGEDMPQYLVAIHHPDNYDPSVETGAISEEIHALNREMIAAGVRIFAGGLSPASNAKSLRAQPDGKVLVTDGPYLETKEHVGGFWILQAADLNEALAWGRKAVVACRAPVEVRGIFFQPAPD
ncbi:MAG: YciI family protein [Candidatus Korobacteraceae bacterium]